MQRLPRVLAIVCALSMFTPGFAAVVAAPAPPDPGALALARALRDGDGLAALEALADHEEVQRLLTTPIPAEGLQHLLATHPPGHFLDARDAVMLEALQEVLAPEWFSPDGTLVVRFLLANYDAARATFTFHTAYPILDALAARLLLAQVAVRDLTDRADAGFEDQFRSFLETGDLPQGWAIESVTQADDAQQQSPGDGEVAVDYDPALIPPDPAGAGPTPQDDPNEDPNQDFYITSCNLCGSSMGAYNSPLTASFDLGETPASLIKEGELNMRTFDVDWFVADPCGTPIEKDDVYLNGRYVGHLTGANNQWSTSTFNLDPAWFVDNQNTITLFVDTMGNGCWRATTSWLHVRINAPKGDVHVVDDSVKSDKEGYNLGDPVKAKATVHTHAEDPSPYPASVEFDLYNPDGAIPDQGTQSVSLSKEVDKELSHTLTIPKTQQVGTVDVGVWTVVATAFDKDGKVSDRGDHEINVGTDVSVTKDEVDLKKVSTNPQTKAMTVSITGKFHYNTAVDEAQSFYIAVYVLQKGQVTNKVVQLHEIPAGGGGGAADIKEFQTTLDMKNKPSVKVVVDSDGRIPEVNEDNNEAVLEDFGQPEVVKVESRLKGNFLAKDALPKGNDYTAEVKDPEIGEPVEKVKWKVTQGSSTVAEGESTARGQSWKYTYDVGKLAKDLYHVEAVAITKDGVESEPKDITFYNFEAPNFLVKLERWGEIFHPSSPQDQGTSVKYWGNAKISISIDLIDAAFGAGADLVKALISALLSTKLCLNSGTIKVGFSAEWGHEAESESSTWKASVKVAASLSFFDKTASLGGSGSLQWTFNQGEWHISGGSLSATAGFQWSCNILNALISLLAPPIGPALAEFNEKFGIVEFSLSFGPSVTVTMSFDEKVRKMFDLIPAKEATITGRAAAEAEASVGFKSTIRAGATLSGDFVVKVGYLAGPHTWSLAQIGFCSTGCGLEVWAKVKFWFVSAEKTLFDLKVFDKGQLLWPKVSGSSISAAEAPWDGRLIVVDTLTPTPAAAPPPAEFVGGIDGLLVRGVPQDRATAAIAAEVDGSVLVLYDVDNLAQTITGSPDIAAAALGANGWGDLGVMVTSPHIDAVPRVAIAPDGRAIAVWERYTDLLDPEDNPFDHLASVRIYYSARDLTGTWSAPAPVAPAAVGMQYAPRVALAPGGSAVVSWLQDADGDILTDDRTPMVAGIADGETGAAAALGVPGAYEDAPAALVLPGGAALAAYVDLGPGGARELLLRTGVPSQGVWSDPLPIALAASSPGSPRLALDAGGLTLAWVERVGQGQRLVERTAPGLAALPLDPSAIPFGQLREVVAADDADPQSFHDLVLTADGAGMRLYAWYDRGMQAVRTLAVEPQAARAGTLSAMPLDAPAVPPGLPDPAGLGDPVQDVQDLVAPKAHRIVDVLHGDVLSLDAAYRPGADALALAATVVEDGATNLRVAQRPLGGDLAILGVATEPANPAPGEDAVVVVRLENAGERPSLPALMATTADDTVIHVDVAPPLQPGQATEVRFDWSTPDIEAPNHLVAVLDPLGLAPDADTSNDRGAAAVTLPDLTPRFLDSSVVAGNRVELLASVSNDGVIASAPGQLAYTLEDGTLLGTAKVAALAPGQAAAASILVAPTRFANGLNRVTATVQAGEDFHPSNDAKDLLAEVLPDLVLEQASLGDVVTGQPASLVAKVANRGAFASEPTRLTGMLDDTDLVVDLAVPALPPGESVLLQASFEAPEGLHVLAVEVNADGSVPDARTSNNGARLTLEPQPAALATVDQASLVYTPTGVLVRVRNAGDGLLTLADFGVYRGAPQDRPKYGQAYVTRVPNLFGVGGLGGVAPHSAGEALVPDASLVIKQVSPDQPQTRTYLRDLAADETVSLRLDPFGTPLDQVQPHMVLTKPLVSIDSPTHPDPTQSTMGVDPVFQLSVVPGRTAAGYSYVLDQTPGTTPDTTVDTTAAQLTFAGLAPGTYWLHARAQFTSGAWTATDHYRVTIAPADTTPPRTQLTPSGVHLDLGDDGLVVLTDTALVLEARDDVSGVASTSYTVDAGAPQAYAGPFTLAEGTHMLSYGSVDRAGNTEATQSLAVRVEAPGDSLSPATMATVLGPSATTPGGLVVGPSASFAFAAEDPFEHDLAPPSGVDRTLYAMDGGAAVATSGPVAVPGAPGAHTLEYWSVDVAGNAEAHHLLGFQVDVVGPTGQYSSPDPDALVLGAVEFVLQASDAPAGVAGIELLHRGGSLGVAVDRGDGTYALSVDTSEWPLGNNLVTALMTDAVANTATAQLRVFVVSRSALLHYGGLQDNIDQLFPHMVEEVV